MSNTISYTTGIYDTYAKIIAHRNGDVTINYGDVEWRNNTGYLVRRNIRLTGKASDKARGVFAGTLIVNNGYGDTYPMTFGELMSEII